MSSVWGWLTHLALGKEMWMLELPGGTGSYGYGEKSARREGGKKEERCGHRTELRKHRYLKESGGERETDLKFLRNTHKGVSNISQRSRASR